VIELLRGAARRNLERAQSRPCRTLPAPLKGEIARIARKEIKADTESLKKQSSKYRSEIAALKRQILDLEKLLRGLATASRGRTSKAASVGEEPGKGGLRFRSKGFAAHRQRLGLSAAQAGALLGVSGQTIYHWEAGKAKPRASQMPRIDALRKLTKKRAAAAVSQVMG
jgi:DNA-binding transcriptional regulator YiaG